MRAQNLALTERARWMNNAELRHKMQRTNDDKFKLEPFHQLLAAEYCWL